MKAAPGGWVDKARRLSSHRRNRQCIPGGLPVSHGVGVGRGREQQLRVGMTWMLDHLFGRASLNHLAGIHYQRLLREIAGAGDVVRDEEERQFILFLETQQQVQHVQANGNVQHRDWLVCQNDRRTHRERPRDSDTLALPAAELVGKFIDKLLSRRQVHALKKSKNLLAFISSIAHVSVQAQGASQVITNTMHRVQRGKGVLENVLNVTPVGPY